MWGQGRSIRLLLAVAVALPVLATVGVATAAVRRPTISVLNPTASSVLEGVAPVKGTTKKGSYSISKVEVGVDGRNYTRASGTSSWSLNLNTSSYSDGSHTLYVKATDKRRYTSTVKVPVTISNSPVPDPEPTPTPTPDPNPTPAPDPTPTPPPVSTPPPGPATWTSPEGTVIEINSAGNWTTDRIYQMLKSAGLNSTIGPSLKVKVQDTYASQVTTAAGTGADGRYSNFNAIMYLQGVNSTMTTQPDSVVSHEYGHVWSLYYLYMAQQGDWERYLTARGLTGDSRLDSSYVWSRREIIAEDYRLLFGSDLAISQNPGHMNTQIPDPRNVAGLREFLQATWVTPR